ncbi:unnamed protein product [Merluccius merluccius]
MLPLGTSIYLLLSLNVVSLTTEDVNEKTQTGDAASPIWIPSVSMHPEPGNPLDPVPLTSGEVDPIHPMVVPLTRHWLPSEDTEGHAVIGEYDDMHDSAKGISLSDNSDLSPPDRSVQEITSSREEEEDGLKGIGKGERGPESTQGPTAQHGLEEASGWGVYHHATQAEENEPPAEQNKSTVDRSVGSVPWPSSGPTHTSALDLAPPTQDKNLTKSVTAQNRPQESQKTEPMMKDEGLTGSPLDRGNNSRQQREEGEIVK